MKCRSEAVQSTEYIPVTYNTRKKKMETTEHDNRSVSL
jgi:hypothetical protein